MYIHVCILNKHIQAKGKALPSTASTLEAEQTGQDSTTDTAETLMSHLLTKAKFEGGPWDAQEASSGDMYIYVYVYVNVYVCLMYVNHIDIHIDKHIHVYTCIYVRGMHKRHRLVIHVYMYV